jgi:RNA polymerase sigma-70 factor (ECF subfamily)
MSVSLFLYPIFKYICLNIQIMIENSILKLINKCKALMRKEENMKISEENFIKHLKKKNEKALEYVIDSYGRLIKSIVNKHLYNLSIYHEECINDVLLAIWYGIDKYDEEKGDFKNWIAAITKYKCIGYKRKYVEGFYTEELDSIEFAVDNISVEIAKQELQEEIESLLDSLKPIDKKLFLEHYIEEKSVKEIATTMNIKDEIIYNRLSRGKKKIRALFLNR